MNGCFRSRAGGERGECARNCGRAPRFDTAGAPAEAIHAASPATLDTATPAPAIDLPAEAPRWIQLIPAGVFRGRDGRGPYRLSNPAAVIAATRERSLDAGIPIDYDHATDLGANAGTPAPAAGWITALEARDGAIWGSVEWTSRAAGVIAAREYRYISPVFQYSPADGSVIRLLRAGLTNNPNLFLTAISAAGGEDQSMDEFMNEMRAALGLADDATPAQILEAITRLAACSMNRAGAPDPAEFVSIGEFHKAVTELNTLRAERAREQAEHSVDAAMRSGKLTPAQREWAIAYCAADPRGFTAFVARQPAVLGGDLTSMRENPAPRHPAKTLSTSEVAICAQLGVTAADYLKRKQSGSDFLRLNRDSSENL